MTLTVLLIKSATATTASAPDAQSSAAAILNWGPLVELLPFLLRNWLMAARSVEFKVTENSEALVRSTFELVRV